MVVVAKKIPEVRERDKGKRIIGEKRGARIRDSSRVVTKVGEVGATTINAQNLKAKIRGDN